MASFIPRKGPAGKRAWQAHIRRRGYPAQVRTFDSKAQAEAWARKIEGEMDRGEFVSRAEAESTSLGEALERYGREVSAKKKGRAAEASVASAWRHSAIASRPLAGIRGHDIAKVRDAWLGKATPATVRNRFALLSHLYNIARQEWGMASLGNPVRDVRIPRTANARCRRLVEDEESRLIEAAKAYGGEIQHVVPWAIETAMRRGEIATMRWEHADRKARVLLIPETKTGTPRHVPLSSRALRVLDDLPRRLDGAVWSMRPDSISQAFERVCAAAKIEGLTFHDLRHEATSRLFEKGLNPMQVAAITGHKTLQMLKRYTHLRAEDLVALIG